MVGGRGGRLPFVRVLECLLTMWSAQTGTREVGAVCSARSTRCCRRVELARGGSRGRCRGARRRATGGRARGGVEERRGEGCLLATVVCTDLEEGGRERLTEGVKEKKKRVDSEHSPRFTASTRVCTMNPNDLFLRAHANKSSSDPAATSGDPTPEQLSLLFKLDQQHRRQQRTQRDHDQHDAQLAQLLEHMDDYKPIVWPFPLFPLPLSPLC